MSIKHIFTTSAFVLAVAFSFSASAQSEFAKSSIGAKAPEAPTTLDCPEGSRLMKSDRSIWCKFGKEYGASEGPYYMFHKNGVVSSVCTHSKGKKFGTCFSYNDDGSILYKREYKDDALLKEVGYFEVSTGGKVMFEREFTTPKLPGKPYSSQSKSYRSNGELKSTEVVQDSKMTQRITYHSNGKKQTEVVLFSPPITGKFSETATRRRSNTSAFSTALPPNNKV